jgi:hypothetical protein
LETTFREEQNRNMIMWLRGNHGAGSDLTLRKAHYAEPRNRRPMAPFLYRCSNTGFRVQGWSPDDDSKEDDVYESVSCLACGQLHLVNLRTGKTLGLHGD